MCNYVRSLPDEHLTEMMIQKYDAPEDVGCFLILILFMLVKS